MIENCNFCRISSTGAHESGCPLHHDNFKSTPLSLGLDNIAAEASTNIVQKYVELLSAYMMTVDLAEIAGEMFGEKRLEIVGNFILCELDDCIDDIINLEEMKDGRNNEE